MWLQSAGPRDVLISSRPLAGSENAKCENTVNGWDQNLECRELLPKLLPHNQYPRLSWLVIFFFQLINEWRHQPSLSRDPYFSALFSGVWSMQPSLGGHWGLGVFSFTGQIHRRSFSVNTWRSGPTTRSQPISTTHHAVTRRDARCADDFFESSPDNSSFRMSSKFVHTNKVAQLS